MRLLGLLTGILPTIGILAIAGVLGAGAQSYYGVAAAHATDRADEGQATNTMSGIITIYATGTIAGPILAGATMSLVGGRGLFLYSAVVLFALAAAMVYRRTDTPPVQDFEKSDFAPVSATSASVYELTEVGSEEAAEAEDPADAMADSGIVLDEEDDLDETSLDDDEDDPDGYWRS